MGKMVRVKHCKVEVLFDIWEDEMKVEDIPRVISDAIDHAGYSCAQMPEVVQVVEKMEPWGEEEEDIWVDGVGPVQLKDFNFSDLVDRGFSCAIDGIGRVQLYLSQNFFEEEEVVAELEEQDREWPYAPRNIHISGEALKALKHEVFQNIW